MRVTDEEGKITEITPDAMDQPQLIRQPNSSGNSFTDFVYDDASRRVATFAPLGHTTASGRPSRVPRSASGGWTTTASTI